MNVFMRIGFNSTIKLVSFNESKVVTLNGEFVGGFRNGDCGIGSQSDNTVSNPHGFIIHWIVIFKDIRKVTEIVDVKNWSVNNFWLCRWCVSLFKWNSPVSSMKYSIQGSFKFKEWFNKCRVGSTYNMANENVPAPAPIRFDDQANLGITTKNDKKIKPHVIPYCRFTKLIIYHLRRKHNINQRSGSSFKVAEDDHRLGNLKSSTKTKKTKSLECKFLRS
uniref:Uncharacterized protein n=1 Tax=Tanacetum cinerariifolium TaxID=118510 RepID=A0A6L2MS95_TANCI|nr:hypothetical protein [Tanacetum cinerariifolium]